MDNDNWLLKGYYDQRNQVFRFAWDLYIKFYTVFLTFNVAALGIVIEHLLPVTRWPIALAFVVQNLLVASTSLAMISFSRDVDRDLTAVAGAFGVDFSNGSRTLPESVLRTPTPTALAKHAGWANCIGCLAMVACWIIAALLKSGGHAG